MSRPSFSEQVCEVRTTPLRAFNANVAILYLALAVIMVIVAWFGSSKTGPAAFDSNVYRLEGHYSAQGMAVPPPTARSLVTLTPWGSALALLGALLIGAMFHFVFAIDFKRQYTLLLVDRCNGMRWAQFAIIHTILAIVIAQMVGCCSFDFLFLALFVLPGLGVLGYFADRAYPCCPRMMNAVTLGTAIIMVGYWVPVITNFAYRQQSAPPYMWIALITLGILDFVFLITPLVQSRSHMSYFIGEMGGTLLLVLVSAIVLTCVSWALTDQLST